MGNSSWRRADHSGQSRCRGRLDIWFRPELTKQTICQAHDDVVYLVARAVKPGQAHKGMSGELRDRTLRFNPDGVHLPVYLVYFPVGRSHHDDVPLLVAVVEGSYGHNGALCKGDR